MNARTLTKVGFVTYNSLPDTQSGWTHNEDSSRSVLIVQDTNGRGSLDEGGRTRSTDEIREEIARLWEVLDNSIPDLDHLVVYVGANGSEKAIEKASRVPVEKLTFVGCSCGIHKKEAMLQASGLEQANRILCECGGHRTMERMIKTFLRTGILGC